MGKNQIFAVVDYSVAFQLFRRNLAHFGKYKPAVDHNSMDFYTMRCVWFVGKNFFANNFVSGLTSMVEGGIYQRWGVNYWIKRLQMRDLIVFREMKKSGNHSIGTENNEEDAEATTLVQVTVPFLLYIGAILGSVAIFLKEFDVLGYLVRLIGSWFKFCRKHVKLQSKNVDLVMVSKIPAQLVKFPINPFT